MQTVSAKPATDLRTRRRALEISQQRLAAAAECSVSAVRLYESGYAPALSPTRARVERVLKDLEAAQ